MEEDDVDLGHVEHPQRDRGRQAERDGQGGGLDIHLRGERETRRERDRVRKTQSFITFEVVRDSLCNRPTTEHV